jgi:hypothetical protein
MHALKARVQNGRFIIDEPANLPDGTELYLVPSNPEWSDEGALTATQRDALEAALERGSADIAAGRVVDAREFLAKLPIP